MAATASSSLARAITRLRRSGNAALSISELSATLRMSSSSFSSSSSVIPSLYDSTLPPSSEDQLNRRRIKTEWLLFVPGTITLALGIWQVFRREDKIKLLESRRRNLDMEPVIWNNVELSSENSELMECRRILCKGVYDEKRSIFLGPRTRPVSGVTQSGYYLITPLHPIPNDPERVPAPILVNRGWVPKKWRDEFFKTKVHPKKPSNMPPAPAPSPTPVQEDINHRSWWMFWANPSEQVEGKTQGEMTPPVEVVEVIGVLRESEPGNIFVPPNEPRFRQWFYVDVPAMARACKLPPNTVYMEDISEDIDPAYPYPYPRNVKSLITNAVMPVDHLNYSLTWFTLSAIVTYMAFKAIDQIKRRRAPKLRAPSKVS